MEKGKKIRVHFYTLFKNIISFGVYLASYECVLGFWTDLDVTRDFQATMHLGKALLVMKHIKKFENLQNFIIPHKMYSTPSFLLSFRLLLTLMVFLGLAALYMQRTNMGIAILCMVNHTSIDSEQFIRRNFSAQSNKCYLEQKNYTSLPDGPFLWPKQTQGIVLFLTGLFHGPCFPSLGTLWSHWVPPNERSRILGIATSGVQIGNIVALPLGGFLCRHGFDDGWPSIFYIYGLIGVIWAAFFLLFISESPTHQKFISTQEKFYIMQNIKKPQKKPFFSKTMK
ncbi:inorganic phosphate cotransporter isoform X1 [Brachionus plicatilis]|uniref:Inorganic phosphate cotransporter isoform X1 n=1 Tax=Brachionus plicatilis TaxID=10195 RepID=A0A3M7QCU4_BRAPC|nr:inorganic phosphate cotransporter isoform X1 [Brachionus plicatilis]